MTQIDEWVRVKGKQKTKETKIAPSAGDRIDTKWTIETIP